MKLFTQTFVISILVINFSFASEIKVFDFTETELSQLQVRKVRGADNKTIYSVGKNENGNFLKSEANNAASGLGKEIIIDLNKTPFINITWKIEQDLMELKKIQKKDMIMQLEFLSLKRQALHLYLIEL